MRKVLSGFLMVLCCGALMMSGCAKEQSVKKDEALAPVQAPQAPAPQLPAATPVKEEAIAAIPAKEAPPAPLKEETLKPFGSAEQSAAEMKLETVYFDFDSFALKQDTRDALARNADYLKKNGSVRVRIDGHCDERGSDEYNLALGEKRAKSAMNYLLTLGVKADRVSTISFGKEKPAVSGHDESAWAKNRRAEFAVVK